jgi:hypothetical protein
VSEVACDKRVISVAWTADENLLTLAIARYHLAKKSRTGVRRSMDIGKSWAVVRLGAVVERRTPVRHSRDGVGSRGMVVFSGCCDIKHGGRAPEEHFQAEPWEREDTAIQTCFFIAVAVFESMTYAK